VQPTSGIDQRMAWVLHVDAFHFLAMTCAGCIDVSFWSHV